MPWVPLKPSNESQPGCKQCHHPKKALQSVGEGGCVQTELQLSQDFLSPWASHLMTHQHRPGTASAWSAGPDVLEPWCVSQKAPRAGNSPTKPFTLPPCKKFSDATTAELNKSSLLHLKPRLVGLQSNMKCPFAGWVRKLVFSGPYISVRSHHPRSSS